MLKLVENLQKLINNKLTMSGADGEWMNSILSKSSFRPTIAGLLLTIAALMIGFLFLNQNGAKTSQ